MVEAVPVNGSVVVPPVITPVVAPLVIVVVVVAVVVVGVTVVVVVAVRPKLTVSFFWNPSTVSALSPMTNTG